MLTGFKLLLGIIGWQDTLGRFHRFPLVLDVVPTQ